MWFDYLGRFFSFPSPFTNAFAYGKGYLNRRHPAAQWLLRAIAGATLERLRGQDDSESAGKLASWIGELGSVYGSDPVNSYDQFAERWEKLHELVQGAEAWVQQPVPPCPAFSEWVPNSFPKDHNAVHQRKQIERRGDLSTEQPWGYEIMEWPPKEGGGAAEEGGER